MTPPWLKNNSLSLFAGLALAATGASGQTAPAPADTGKPNILFIMADDAGYGDFGCYGQHSIQTPNIDQLAAQGVRFLQFYSGAPVCAPARNTLMTGQHTGHTLIRGNAKVDLRPEDTTVAEVLKKAGYATGMVGKMGPGHGRLHRHAE